MTLFVWDAGDAPAVQGALVYRWNGYAEDDSCLSLMRYIEVNAERLRGKYIRWIHDLGESRVDGRRLSDLLALDNGLSFWWLTAFVEQNPWKSPSIAVTIRLLALEEIVEARRPTSMHVCLGDPKVVAALRKFCARAGIAFMRTAAPHAGMRCEGALARMYRGLPQVAQAGLTLARYLRSRWPLRRATAPVWVGGPRAMTVCSYFINVAPGPAAEGHFHSRYWERLHALLAESRLGANWLQIYYPHATVPDAPTADALLMNFNRREPSAEVHAFTDAWISWGVVVETLRRFAGTCRVSLKSRGLRSAFTPAGSRMCLWEVVARDWATSLRGPSAIVSLLAVSLFERALGSMPRQHLGLFLFENQGWEKAFIHAWKRHGHGSLVAVAHATVRFWDLRYFTDPRLRAGVAPHLMPHADLLALNGPPAVESCVAVGFPREKIRACEALRYGNLSKLRPNAATNGTTTNGLRILVLGDYYPPDTAKMLGLLQSAARHLDQSFTFTLKPHPNCPVNPADYPDLVFSTTNAPLDEILHEFDSAYAGNTTSAAVDACAAGLPVVVMLDGGELNYSPLRGSAGVTFVGSPEELALALAAKAPASPAGADSFFYLDDELPRWRALLSETFPDQRTDCALTTGT